VRGHDRARRVRRSQEVAAGVGRRPPGPRKGPRQR
jgi:hypothetical protein